MTERNELSSDPGSQPDTDVTNRYVSPDSPSVTLGHLSLTEFHTVFDLKLKLMIDSLARLRGICKSSLVDDSQGFRLHMASTARGYINTLVDSTSELAILLSMFTQRLSGEYHAKPSVSRSRAVRNRKGKGTGPSRDDRKSDS